MPKYVLFYHMTGSPQQSSQNEMMQKWQDWMAAHSKFFVEPQNPLAKAVHISKNSVTKSDTPSVMGYSVLSCADQQTAIEIVQSCPFLELGDVELAQIMT